MYDKATIQNNYNGGSPARTDEYRNGAGVFIRTGGGVQLTGFGLFTMEGNDRG